MVAFAGGLSVAAFTAKIVEVQREFDVLNSSLITVTGSSQAAAREMEWIKKFAKETPFGLAQATQAFVKMKSLGLDPSREALTSYGNTASAMGKDLNQMIEAVADASTGQFERLREFGRCSAAECSQKRRMHHRIVGSLVRHYLKSGVHADCLLIARIAGNVFGANIQVLTQSHFGVHTGIETHARACVVRRKRRTVLTDGVFRGREQEITHEDCA